MDDQEMDAVVMRVLPWGVVAESDEGVQVTMDWVRLGRTEASLVERLHCVILDATRGTASTLSSDIEIARKFRSGELGLSEDGERLEWLRRRVASEQSKGHEPSAEALELAQLLRERSTRGDDEVVRKVRSGEIRLQEGKEWPEWILRRSASEESKGHASFAETADLAEPPHEEPKRTD